jgi:hypothetical protein
MLFLGDVPMQHRFARFEAECHIRRLARFADCPSINRSPSITVSWTLGQRLGDTLQWAAVDLHSEMDGRLVITVRRGKTLGVTPPYVLALHNGPLAADLLALKSRCNDDRLFLWTPHNTPRSERR